MFFDLSEYIYLSGQVAGLEEASLAFKRIVQARIEALGEVHQEAGKPVPTQQRTDYSPHEQTQLNADEVARDVFGGKGMDVTVVDRELIHRSCLSPKGRSDFRLTCGICQA